MSTISFKHLTDTEFEEFCFDLLHEMKFVNVDWRKGTPLRSSPADKGRDIVAQLLRTDVDESKHLETWFVDSKHFKKAVPPSELRNLLAWAEAERPDTALFIASGFLSNPAKDFLETYERNNRPPFKIKYWERHNIQRMTRRKIVLLRKHNLTTDPLRSVQTILTAEEEFFDRVWYDRHQLLRQSEREGGSKTPRVVLKGARAAAKRVEAKYGRKNLGPYTEFDWGMINGKLSALRWVLGDDWDMLDT
jgi:Restriction endonuclease